MRALIIGGAMWLAAVVFVGLNHARAEIVFHEDNITTDENLQFNDDLEGGPAITVQGQTQTSETVVDISRVDAAPILLFANGGQARIEATATNDTDTPALFSGALFEPVGVTITAFEFNINADEDGELTILVEDINGETQSSDDDAGFDGSISSNGNNRFGVTATAGMEIVNVTVLLDGAIVADIRQVRLGGIVAIPEPAAIFLSTMALAAFVLICRATRLSQCRASGQNENNFLA